MSQRAHKAARSMPGKLCTLGVHGHDKSMVKRHLPKNPGKNCSANVDMHRKHTLRFCFWREVNGFFDFFRAASGGGFAQPQAPRVYDQCGGCPSTDPMPTRSTSMASSASSSAYASPGRSSSHGPSPMLDVLQGAGSLSHRRSRYRHTSFPTTCQRKLMQAGSSSTAGNE